MAISAEELNIILQVRDQQFQKAMQANERRVARFSQRGGQSLDRFGRSYTNMGRSVGAQRAALQNASFQIQDILTQITMGTPALRALSVQLPQLLGGFGAAGAAIGVAVGALGLFTPASNKAEGATKSLGDQLEASYASAKSALEAAREAQDRYAAAIALTGAAQSQVTPEILSNLKLEAQAREALARLEMARLERSKAALEASIPPLQERIRLIGEQVRAEMSADNTAGSAQERAAAERRIVEETQKRLDAAYELTGELQEQKAQLDLINAQLGLNNGEASEFINNLIEANKNAEGTASAVSSINFSSAIEGAIALSQQLGVSLHQAMQIMGLVGAAANAARAQAERNAVIFDPRDPRYDPIRAEMARGLENTGSVSPFDPSRIPKVSGGGGGGGRKGGGGSTRDPLADLLKEVALNEKLLGMSEARADVMRRLGDDAGRYSEAEITSIAQRIEAYERERDALQDIVDEQQAIADTIEGSLTDAWMSSIEGAESFGDAIKSMARNVIAELTRVLVVQRAVGSFDASTGTGSGIVGAIMGMFSGRASGGSVMAGQGYMVGEHGREPFIPSQNGRILSVAQAKGAMGGGGSTIINQNNTFMSDVKQAVRAEIKSQQRQQIEATVAAVEARQKRRPT